MTWKRPEHNQHYSSSEIEKILKNCQKGTPIVTQKKKEPITKLKPYPLTTIELQKLGTRVLKLTGHQIMTAAERLYTQGLISYPRTETNFYDKTISTKALLKRLESSQKYGDYVSKLLNNKEFSRPRNGKKNDKAHPPIHPVRLPESPLKPFEEKVYNLIVLHFLAQCSKDAQGEKISVTVQLADQLFEAKEESISIRGYLEAYEKLTKSQKNSKNDQKPRALGAILEGLQEGQKLSIAELKTQRAFTQPPRPLSEADLVAKMETHGIGTDSTIHEHIKKLFDREYARREGQFIRATDLGLSLVEAYEDMGVDLHKPDLRSNMEADLASIADGEKTKEEVVEEYVEIMSEIFDQTDSKVDLFIQKLKDRYGKPASEGTSELDCPKCSDMKLDSWFTSGRKGKAETMILGRVGCDVCAGETYWTPVEKGSLYKVLYDENLIDAAPVIKYFDSYGSEKYFTMTEYGKTGQVNESGEPEVENNVKTKAKRVRKKKNEEVSVGKEGIGYDIDQSSALLKYAAEGSSNPKKTSKTIKKEEETETIDAEESNQLPKNAITKCPECGIGHIVIKKRNGKHEFMACDNFPECRTAGSLPFNVTQTIVTDQSCPCGKFNMVRFNSKYYDPNVLYCLGCDEQLQEEGYEFSLKKSMKSGSKSGKRRQLAYLKKNQTQTQTQASESVSE